MKENAEKTVKTINDFKELLDSQDGLPTQTLTEILSSTDMGYVDEAFTIVDKYREDSAIFEIEPTILQDDMTKLAAINIRQAMVTGFLVGLAKHSEEDLKLAKSKIQVKAKTLKSDLEEKGELVKLTEKDIEALTRIKTQDLILKKMNESAIAESAKHFYYAIQAFIEVLRSNYVRTNEER